MSYIVKLGEIATRTSEQTNQKTIYTLTLAHHSGEEDEYLITERKEGTEYETLVFSLWEHEAEKLISLINREQQS